MYRIMVLYPQPKDPNHFKDYYTNKHIPKAKELPNLLSMSYGFELNALEGGDPYFCVWQGNFENQEKLMEALQSEQGQAVANDVENYATGGFKIMHFEILED